MLERVSQKIKKLKIMTGKIKNIVDGKPYSKDLDSDDHTTILSKVNIQKFELQPHILENLINTIGRKYALLILLKIGKYQILRYNELHDKISGIYPTALASVLKQLQKQGLIRRSVFGEIPPLKVEYSLTQKGKNFIKALKPLLEFLSSDPKIRCSECNCSPDECKKSKSEKECPNCTLTECCVRKNLIR